ncbi:hypothetical protein CRE_19958 [Caenorhabditis remanei]|uniref:Uncharacterized protein n=1 Tax=Caenorhabditis remanei TaxID=31234 RepID=E3N8D5_CAERE|nr:hypothetical protein CRE_19958 [Caenorhabditis remanei]
MSLQRIQVKTKPAPLFIWQQPPRLPLPELPQRDPSRQLSFSQYVRIEHNSDIVIQDWHQSELIRGRDKEMIKLVILDIISTMPKLLPQYGQGKHRLYAHVAIDVYKRTGCYLSSKAVSTCFRMEKENLRHKLKKLVKRRMLSVEKVEDKLWKEYPNYGSIRFFRAETWKWETKTRKNATVDKKGEPIIFDVSDDEEEVEGDDETVVGDITEDTFDNDETGFEPAVDNTNQSSDVHADDEQEPVDGYFDDRTGLWFTDPPMYENRPSEAHPLLFDNNVPSTSMQNWPIQDAHSPLAIYQTSAIQPIADFDDQVDHGDNSGIEPPPFGVPSLPGRHVAQSTNRTPARLEDVEQFRRDIGQIKDQAERVAKKHPEKAEMMRQALLEIVQICERSDTTDLGQMFAQLARRNDKNLFK